MKKRGRLKKRCVYKRDPGKATGPRLAENGTRSARAKQILILQLHQYEARGAALWLARAELGLAPLGALLGRAGSGRSLMGEDLGWDLRGFWCVGFFFADIDVGFGVYLACIRSGGVQRSWAEKLEVGDGQR